jgi:SPP1 gp7 family putative phage head morphogenesis protein
MPPIDAKDFLALFDLPPKKALEFLKELGIEPAWSWDDMIADARKRSFIISKVMAADVLQDVKTEIESAVADGMPFADFKKKVRERLAARGWLGERPVKDPETGKTVGVDISTPYRLELIFRQNTQDALNAGRYVGQLENITTRPYGQYSAIRDRRTTSQCLNRDGVILPLDDPWWDENYPANHFRCRARVTTLSESQLERRGLAITPFDKLDKLPPLAAAFKRKPTDVYEPDLSKYDPKIRKQLKEALSP